MNLANLLYDVGIFESKRTVSYVKKAANLQRKEILKIVNKQLESNKSNDNKDELLGEFSRGYKVGVEETLLWIKTQLERER